MTETHTTGPLARADWAQLLNTLDEDGVAVAPGIYSADDCAKMASLYADDGLFRSTVTMARHGFGRGEYRYFRYPLPAPIQDLRSTLYAQLATLANRWAERLGGAARYPAAHKDYLALCAEQGQTRPTPLLLRYGPGDYNRLHQDLYGAEMFPLQAAILLSRPGEDFEGGEFVMTETRPRMQSRAIVAPLRQGDMVVFAVNARPTPSARGWSRATMRHGVSVVRCGGRVMLGIILHDAA